MVAKTVFSEIAGSAKESIKKRHDLQKVILIICIPLNILGFIGNGIVLWPLCYKLKKTRFIVYFQNMTGANLIMILYNFSGLLEFFTPFHANLIFSRTVDMVRIFVYDTNFFFLTAIAAERCLTLFFPAWWQHHRPKYFSLILSLILWILSSLVSLVDNFSCYPRFYADYDDFLNSCENSTIFKIIVFLLFFIAIMVFSTSGILIRMQSRNHQNITSGLDVTIITTVFLFFIFNATLRMFIIMTFWDPPADRFAVATVFMLFNSIYISSTPFVCIFIGFLRSKEPLEPLHVFVQRALSTEEREVEKMEIKVTTEQT